MGSRTSKDLETIMISGVWYVFLRMSILSPLSIHEIAGLDSSSVLEAQGRATEHPT